MKILFLRIGVVLILIFGVIAALYEKALQDDAMRTLIDKIELALVMPPGSHALKSYVRYYARETINDHDYIVGTFVFNGSGGRIELVNFYRLPQIADGGCDVVEMRYSVVDKNIVSLFCHGVS